MRTLGDLLTAVQELVERVGGEDAAAGVPLACVHQSSWPLRERVSGLVVHQGEATLVLDGHPREGSPYGDRAVWDGGDGVIGHRAIISHLPEGVKDHLVDGEGGEVRELGPGSEERLIERIVKAFEMAGLEVPECPDDGGLDLVEEVGV
jgi:hypothetical protein